MQSSLKPLAVGACVSALAAAFLVGPASAAPPTLVLSIEDKNTLLVPNTRTLGCDRYPQETTGSHPRREKACEALEKAGGRFDNLATTGMACTMIYDPVTATARGSYKGVRVHFEATYSNECVARAESSEIFPW